MRTALRLLGTRYGIAVILIVLVLAVVSGGRLLAGSQPPNTVGPAVAPPPSKAAPSGLDLGDDSAVEPNGSEPGPSLSASTPTVSAVATRFIAAWLKHTGVTAEQWRASLTPNATAALMTKLQDTDPGSVPADSLSGDITVIDEGGSVWSASVPVNGGTVTLRVVAVRGRWQVDGIDWSPS
jgi:hypothetical protein